MDWYTFCLGLSLLLIKAVEEVTSFLLHLFGPRWIQLAQVAAPSLPDIGSLYNQHGAIGILFWVIAACVAVIVGLVGVIIILWKQSNKWMDAQDKLLNAHFAQKEEFRSLREDFKQLQNEVRESNTHYIKMLERVAWQRGPGD